MTITYDPHHPQYLDEADVRDELTRVFDVCHGCRLCVDLCSVVPDAVRPHRPARRPGRRRLTPAEQDQRRRRVLPVQALLRQLPVRARPERVGDRLPPADAAGRRHAPRHGRRCPAAPADRQRDGAHRSARQARARAAAPAVNAVDRPPGRRRARSVIAQTAGISSERLLPPFARQRFTTWFKQAAAGAHGATAGQGDRLPHVPRRVPGPGGRPRPRPGLRAQRDRVRRRLPRVLRRAVAAQRRRRALRRGGRGQREGRWPTPCEPGTDIVVPQPTCGYVLQEGLRRLRRRRRRRAGRRPHLRRRRVPDAGAPGRDHHASTSTSPATCPRRSRTTRPATSGPRTSA